MHVTPLTMTQVNWSDLLLKSTKVQGRSASSSLDRNRIKPGDPFSFVAALSEMKKTNSDPKDSVRQATWQLHHFSFGVLVELSQDEAGAFLPFEGLTVSYFRGTGTSRRQANDELLLISGTLAEWQPLIHHYVNVRMNDWEHNVRADFFLTVRDLLNKVGLRDLFL